MKVQGSYTASLWSLQKAIEQPGQLLSLLEGESSGSNRMKDSVGQPKVVASPLVSSSSAGKQSVNGKLVDSIV